MPCGIKEGLFAINFALLLLGIGQIKGASVALDNGDPYGLWGKDFPFSLHITNFVVGVFIIIMSFLGCFVVFRNNTFMIKVYACLMTMFLVLEVSLIISTICFVCLADSILTKAMYNIFADYGEPAHMHVTSSLDIMQHLHFCCGVRNYSDWEQYPFGKQRPQSVADGCCKQEYSAVGCGIGLLAEPDAESKIYTRGCSYVLQELVIGDTLVVGSIMLIVAILQLMCVLAAFKLHSKIKQENLQPEKHALEQTPLQVLGNKGA